MSNRKSIIVLLFGIVLAAVVLWALVIRSQSVASVRTRTHLLQQDPALITSIEVSTPAYTALVERVSTYWMLRFPEGGEAIADSVVVAKILDALALTPIGDTLSLSDLRAMEVTTSAFGFSDSALTIRVKGAAETVVSFGNSTPGGGEVYAMADRLANVFSVPRSVIEVVPAEFSGFRPKRAVTTTPSSVTAIDIRIPDSPFAKLVRVPNGGWRLKSPESAPAFAPTVNLLLSELASAQILAYLDSASAIAPSKLASYGIDAERGLSVTLHSGDSSEQIVFGKWSETEAHALVQNGTAVVTVPASLVKLCMAPGDSYRDKRLFPVVASSVDSITVMKGDEIMILAKTNDQWMIEAPVSAEADVDKVNACIAALLELETGAGATGGPSVKMGGVTAPVPEVICGDFGRFRSLSMLNLDPAVISKVTVTPAVMNPPTADSICSLTADSVRFLSATPEDMAACGLVTPTYTIAIDLTASDSIRKNVLIGAKLEDGSRYAALSASPTIFTLSAESLAALGL